MDIAKGLYKLMYDLVYNLLPKLSSSIPSNQQIIFDDGVNIGRHIEFKGRRRSKKVCWRSIHVSLLYKESFSWYFKNKHYFIIIMIIIIIIIMMNVLLESNYRNCACAFSLDATLIAGLLPPSSSRGS